MNRARVSERDARRWVRAMSRGDFATAWTISDRVLAERVASGPRWDLARHEQWIWDGSDLGGRAVLVRCYHGLGDTIQFARFLPMLARAARQVTVWAQPWLIPLLATMPNAGSLLPLHDGIPETEYDTDVEIMELAHALRITRQSLPTPPYFEVQPARRLSERFSVGVVAQAGGWDERRSVQPACISRLSDAWPQAAWFSLQMDEALPGMCDARQQDVLRLAAQLRALDLVITVDTMMAHLAGALGVTTWLLLRASADWRWGDDRQDSMWYPSVRLFRQRRAGDWQDVMEQVRVALGERIR